MTRSGARATSSTASTGNAELVLAQAKHQELPLLARLVDLRLRPRRIAGFAEPFHDVLPKELFRREDRDQPSPFLAAIDRFDAGLAARTRLNHGRHGIDQRRVGGDDGARAIGDETDQAAANGRDDDLLARFRNRGGRKAEQFAHRKQGKQLLAKRHHARDRPVDARRRRDGAGQRDDLLNDAEIESKFLARDVESDEGLALRRCFWRLGRGDAARLRLDGSARMRRANASARSAWTSRIFAAP